MERMTVIDSEYATLWFYPDTKIVRHVFHKFIYGQEFHDVLTKGRDVMKQYGGQKWLSDDRKNSALPTEDLIWALDSWSPGVFELGWKYWAIVMPDKVAGQLNMNRFMKRYVDLGLVIEVFSDEDDALHWLESI